MFQRLYTIAANTFVETVRQPLFGIILLATAMLLMLNVSLAAFTLDDDDKLLLDLGLSTLLLSGLFLSAFSASGVLSREIENKTVLTVISKPVSRPLFILGKYAGLMAALFLAFFISFLVFILTVRHGVMQNSSDPWDAPVLVFGAGSVVIALTAAGFFNFFLGKDFPTMVFAILTPLLTAATLLVGKFDEGWAIIPFGQNFVGGQVILAAYLVLLILFFTAAVALAASTRFGEVMTLVICISVVGLGVISDYAFGQHEGESLLAGIAYRVVPNVGAFWVIDGLNAESAQTAVTFEYVGLATLYALLLTVGILGIATSAFQRREVG